MPLVSVVIPTYNRPIFTKEAVQSVLGQTFQDFEIIVVDDGSSEDIESLLPAKGQGIRFFKRKHRGVAAARNYGVSVAKGEYVAFLDSDDLWEKKKLEKQLEYLKQHPEFKICYTNETWIRSGVHLNQMKKHQKYHGRIFAQCLPLCTISCSSILIETKIFDELGGFDESFPACEDYELWLRMTCRYPVAFLEEKLIIKRGGHPDQLSGKYWGMDRFRIRALEKILQEKLDENQKAPVRQELNKKYKIILNGAWRRKRFILWLYYYLKSLSKSGKT